MSPPAAAAAADCEGGCRRCRCSTRCCSNRKNETAAAAIPAVAAAATTAAAAAEAAAVATAADATAACSLPSLTPPHRPRPYGVNFVRAQILNLHFAWTRSRRRRARRAPWRQHCALLCDARAPAVTTCRARTYDRGGHVQEGASHRSPRSASSRPHVARLFSNIYLLIVDS